jgi:hypothetical protein
MYSQNVLERKKDGSGAATGGGILPVVDPLFHKDDPNAVSSHPQARTSGLLPVR